MDDPVSETDIKGNSEPLQFTKKSITIWNRLAIQKYGHRKNTIPVKCITISTVEPIIENINDWLFVTHQYVFSHGEAKEESESLLNVTVSWRRGHEVIDLSNLLCVLAVQHLKSNGIVNLSVQGMTSVMMGDDSMRFVKPILSLTVWISAFVDVVRLDEKHHIFQYINEIPFIIEVVHISNECEKHKLYRLYPRKK